jgi:hypothetical protein
MKFFVVKVNPVELKKKGTSFLSPLADLFRITKVHAAHPAGHGEFKGFTGYDHLCIHP